jgi:hypothetical protein
MKVLLQVAPESAGSCIGFLERQGKRGASRFATLDCREMHLAVASGTPALRLATKVENSVSGQSLRGDDAV